MPEQSSSSNSESASQRGMGPLFERGLRRRDGTYAATTTIEGRTTREIGTYKFNGFTLKLRPQTGGERSYGAVRHAASIEVTHDSNKVVLRKGRAKTDDEAP